MSETREFSGFTNAELAALIRAASVELERRLASVTAVLVEPPPRTVTIGVPDADDVDFCMYVKGLLAKGGYVKAEERARVAEIAEKYPEWVKRNQLPTSAGAGAWRRAGEYISAPRAKRRI
jgi:hypothetical protein